MRGNEIVQISNLPPCGEYAHIRVYDDGGKSIDRYTVVFMDCECDQRTGYRYCVAMGDDVVTPQGFYQHCDGELGPHLGKRIPFSSLPLAHRERIIAELRECKAEEAGAI